MKQSTKFRVFQKSIHALLLILWSWGVPVFAQPGDPSVFGDETWNAYCYNGFGLNNYRGYFTMDTESFDTRDYYDESDVPSDAIGYNGLPITGWFHSISIKRQGFNCGQYTLSIPAYSGFGTVLVNGVAVYSHGGWFGGSAGDIWSGYLGPNATVEYVYRKLFGGSFCVLEFEQNNGPTTVWSGALNSDWFNAGNWSDGMPDAAVNAQITTAGTAPTIDGSGAVAKTVTIDPGASLSISTDEILSIYGDLNVEGQLSAADAGLRFQSACPNAMQNINATSTLELNRLEKLGTGTLSNIGGEINITEELSVDAGTFHTGDAVTLVSNADGTACLGPIGADTNIDGDITVQRYIMAGNNGWVQLGSAVSGQTFVDWSDDVITTGFPGSDYPNFNFNNIRLYDETQLGHQDTGLYFASNISDPIQDLHGYQVYLAAGTMNIDVTGPPITGDQDFGITFHSSEALFGSAFSDEHDGWNLVSNPYASTIDWDAPTGWVKTNITGAIYVWDAEIGQYNTYDDGVGVNGGSNLIPSSQAFWVQANDNGPQLIINENAKSSSQGEFKMEEEQSVLRLMMTGASGTDEVALRITPQSIATQSGVQKLYSPEAVPKLGIIGDNGTDLAIKNISSQGATSIPLRQAFPQAGSFALSADFSDYETLNCIFLEDLETGVWTDLRDSNYTFDAEVSQLHNRFVLHFGAPLNYSIQPVSCADAQDGSVSWDASEDWNILLSHAESDFPVSTSNGMADELAEGTYILSVESNGQCALSTTQAIAIEGPEEIVVDWSTENTTCHNTADGTISLAPSGGSAPYSVAWGDGFTGLQRTNAGAGTYIYELTDSMGCTQDGLVELSAETTVESNFSVGSSALTAGQPVTLFNLSEGADNYTWNFGDGTPSSDLFEPELIYTTPGNYFLMLLAKKNGCVDIHTEILTVSELLTGADAINDKQGLHVYSDGQNAVVEFNFDRPHELQVDLLNVIGQAISAPRAINAPSGIERIQVPEKGVVIVRVTDRTSGESVQERIYMW